VVYEVGETASANRWLVRFGYDGSGYFGWARQPGLRTVEGTILAGLARSHTRRTLPFGSEHLDVASRTDRGVSARANALALRTTLSGATLLRFLNGCAPEIFFTAATPVPEEFRTRAAARRIYRYWDPGPPERLMRWRSAAAVFRGPVDARSFGRGVLRDSPRFVEVQSVSVEEVPGGRLVEVRARSFVWGMVRKIVSALREHAAGRLPLSDLEAGIRGTSLLSLPLAEPQGLVLWEVEYPIDWMVRWQGPSRRQRAYLGRTATDRWLGERVATAWTDGG